MTQLAAMIAIGAVAEYRVMLGAALTMGVTPIEAEEIVHQAVPYATLDVPRKRVADFENRREIAASTDYPAGQ